MTTAFDGENLRLNFADTGDQLSFEPIPAGLYYCEITDASIRAASDQAKNPGAPILNVAYTVQADGDYFGRRIFDNITIITDDEDPNSFWKRKLKGLLGAIGEDTSDGDIDVHPSDLIGKELDVKVSIQGARVDPNTKREYPSRNQAQAFYPHTSSVSDMLS